MEATEVSGTAVARSRENVEKSNKEGNIPKSVRVPVSLAQFLDERPEGITGYVLEAIELKRDLDELLEGVKGDLVRIAANELGREYTSSQAATIAHIVTRCLKAKK